MLSKAIRNRSRRVLNDAGTGPAEKTKEGWMNNFVKGAVIATAVAGLFLAKAGMVQAQGEAKKEATVKCEGVNECKGKGACGGAGHDCAGKNSCKGKGWVEMSSAADCKAKGGTVKQ
jgi:hypothetical protein